MYECKWVWSYFATWCWINLLVDMLIWFEQFGVCILMIWTIFLLLRALVLFAIGNFMQWNRMRIMFQETKVFWQTILIKNCHVPIIYNCLDVITVTVHIILWVKLFTKFIRFFKYEYIFYQKYFLKFSFKIYAS